MTRLECEKKLLSLAEQMRAVYLEYNPAGDFMTAIIDADGYINVNDCFFNVGIGGIQCLDMSSEHVVQLFQSL